MEGRRIIWRGKEGRKKGPRTNNGEFKRAEAESSRPTERSTVGLRAAARNLIRLDFLTLLDRTNGVRDLANYRSFRNLRNAPSEMICAKMKGLLAERNLLQYIAF